MRYAELKRVEHLARMADMNEPEDERPVGPTRWGPASWWRIGLVVLGLLIAILLVTRLFD